MTVDNNYKVVLDVEFIHATTQLANKLHTLYRIDFFSLILLLKAKLTQTKLKNMLR